MARTVSRSARSGRFVKASTARRSPSTTTTERVGRGTSNTRTVQRSAATGRFVRPGGDPGTTISQRV